MSCTTLDPGLAAFTTAAHDLIRPAEVAHLVKRPGHVTPAQVGAWIARERKAGRLRYLPDPSGGRDHWCSPRATLAKGGGDCEDLAILAVSLLRLDAFSVERVCVGWRTHPTGRRESHAWVEGQRQGQTFFIEATTGKVLPARPDHYALVKAL